jgi:hypothetical protein
MAQFAQRGTWQIGLFTFPNSRKHHALYQKFGFYPRFLTFIMAKPIQPHQQDLRATKSSQNPQQRSQCLKACAELTNAIYAGLDVSREIVALRSKV